MGIYFVKWQNYNSHMTHAQIFLMLIIAFIIGLTIFKIYTVNDLSTRGAEYAYIQDQITEVKKENILLREQVYHYSSLTTIEQEATVMGFVKMGEPIYISK